MKRTHGHFATEWIGRCAIRALDQAENGEAPLFETQTAALAECERLASRFSNETIDRAKEQIRNSGLPKS